MIVDRPEDWHPRAFFAGSLFSVALLVSWYLEPTRSIWLDLDEQFFWAANNSLAWGRSWRVLWAAANFRAVDIIAALSMVGLYAHYVFRRRRAQLNRFVAVGLMLTTLLVVAKRFADALAVVHRRSPTLVHTDALRLSELVPWIPTKDSAVDCFPGDHCMVLLICAGVISFYLPRAWSIGAWIITVVFTLPRLMGGAHWLSDNLVGSTSVAGFVLTWVLATPLHGVISDGIEKLLRRSRKRLARAFQLVTNEESTGG